MQSSEAEALRNSWGDKPCDHPNIDKEYYLGAQTGDFNCVQCGATFFSRAEWEAARVKPTDDEPPSQG
jgi:hypothetical protein